MNIFLTNQSVALPKTLKPVSQQESDRLCLDGKPINCVQVKQNSVCWNF